jgi:hypothetical protein
MNHYQAQWLKPILLATWEMEIGRMVVQSPDWIKKFSYPISTNKSWMWRCAPVIPATQEVQMGGSQSRPA